MTTGKENPRQPSTGEKETLCLTGQVTLRAPEARALVRQRFACLFAEFRAERQRRAARSQGREGGGPR
jgi:hypothetical protein